MQIIARQRDERRRAEFRRFIAQFNPDQFLFVDESSKDDRTLQVYYFIEYYYLTSFAVAVLVSLATRIVSKE